MAAFQSIVLSQRRLICSQISSSVRKKGQEEPNFRVFEIPGMKKTVDTRRERRKQNISVGPPRYLKMETSHDWSNAWPTASSFKWSVVPLPIRQGYVENSSENEGIIPGKQSNAELMKIPNFLHLSPSHIKKHCEAIKQYCTDWPKGLETNASCRAHFPVEIATSDYCHSGPSVRDPRARRVQLQVKLSRLNLGSDAHDKFVRLVGDRYDAATGMLTIIADRCPVKKQNYDYAMYLLTALYHESRKVEPWEAEKSESDISTYSWNSSQSKATCLSVLQSLPEKKHLMENDLLNSEAVVHYAKAVEALQNGSRSHENINAYKDSVLKMLDLNVAA